MARITLSTVVLSLALVAVSEAYPGGAPASVCESLAPEHGAPIQETEFPYTLITTKKGNQILITLKPNSTSDSFKGFILQVRNNKNAPIGSFNTTQDTKTLDCSPGKKVSF